MRLENNFKMFLMFGLIIAQSTAAYAAATAPVAPKQAGPCQAKANQAEAARMNLNACLNLTTKGTTSNNCSIQLNTFQNASASMWTCINGAKKAVVKK